MQDAIKAILRILETGTPELRIAAAQILGALRPTDVAVVKSLVARLDDGEHYLARHILTALAEIESEPAILALVGRIGTPGPDGDLVAHLLRGCSDAAIATMSESFEQAEPEARVRILELLASKPSPEAAATLEKALYDPSLAVKAADSLVSGSLEMVPAAKRRYLKDRLKKALTKKDAKKDGKKDAAKKDESDEIPTEVLAQLLRVYAVADPEDARAVLIKYVDASQPPCLREVALRSLHGIALTPTQATTLLDFLDDDDLEHIVRPTMALLVDHSKWNEAGVAALRKLLGSRRDHLRLFAIRTFRHVPNADVVKTLVQHLLGDNAAMSEAAGEALGHNPAAAEGLLRCLALEKDVLRARLLSRPLQRIAGSISKAQVQGLVEKGCKALAANEEIGEVHLEVALAVQNGAAAADILDRALRLRRVKKLDEALHILLYLAKAQRLDAEGRYQLALTRLLIDSNTPLIEAGGAVRTPGDATMGHFSSLVRESFPVFDRIKKESSVTPEAMLRMGRHFAASVGSERRFGAELLEFLAQKHAKARAGEEARSVLRAGGL